MAGAKEKASTAVDEEEATTTAAAMAATAAWNCIVYIWSSGREGMGGVLRGGPGGGVLVFSFGCCPSITTPKKVGMGDKNR